MSIDNRIANIIILVDLNLADYQIQIQSLEVSFRFLASSQELTGFLVTENKSYIYTYRCPHSAKAISDCSCQLNTWSIIDLTSRMVTDAMVLVVP